MKLLELEEVSRGTVDAAGLERGGLPGEIS
jgi:hypothetical protein